MLQLGITVAIAIVLVIWARRRDARRPDASRTGGLARRSGRRQAAARTQANAEAPPAKFITRWRVDYLDAAGKTTKRVVRVQRVYPPLQQLDCWCELRQARRTLNFSGLRRIVDAETGEIIDLAVWLDAREKSRGNRAKRQAAGVAPARPAAGRRSDRP